MKFSSANEVIHHLYTLPHLHPKNDLSYIKRLLKKLKDPQNKVKTIHVTGTNGKGSTSYYLSNLLQKAGQRTGLFVSPYIREFNERIQLNGNDIPDSDLVETANKVEAAIEKIKQVDPTFNLVTFEYETAMAFTYFAACHCDYAVIEVGIGGEHDKTNVITPEVSVITTIGLDHEKIIGPTIQDIAREKSGIIKHQRPVILGNVPQTVMPILLNEAEKAQSPVLSLGRDFMVSSDQKIKYQFRQNKLNFKLRPLVESYDIAVAVTAFYQLHLSLAASEIEAAINQTAIPGRYQLISSQPAIILDGAHNIQAMKNLLTFIHAHQKKNGKIKVLITMMKDKDLEEVFSLFSEKDQVELTTIPYPRAAKKEDYPSLVQKKYHFEVDYRKAFYNLKKELGPDDLLLVTGSFYLVSAILQLEE